MSAAKEDLRAILAPLLGVEAVKVKDSDLLKAYAIFTSHLTSQDHFMKSYCSLVASNQYPAMALLRIPMKNISSALVDKAYMAFRHYSLEKFLRFIVPDLAADPLTMCSFYKEVFKSDILWFIYVVIRIRTMMYNEKRNVEADDLTHTEDSLLDESLIGRLFLNYRSTEPNDSFLLTKEQFIEFFCAINLYTLHGDEALNINPIGYKKDELDNALDILNRQLEISRAQQIELCHKFFVDNKGAKTVAEEEDLLRFMQIKQTGKRKELFFEAMSLIAKMPPIDVLAAVYYRRKSYRKSNHITNQIFSPNDVALETSLIYPLFSSEVNPNSTITVFFPSVFFVKKWLADPFLKQQDVRFVFKTRYESELVSFHYHENSYDSTDVKNATFMSFSAWDNRYYTGERQTDDEKILAFFSSIPQNTQEKIYKHLYAEMKHKDLFLVIGCHEFEQSCSPFSAALCDPRFLFRSIELLPQGINNSAQPRKKMYIQAEIFEVPQSEKQKVTIKVDKLNLDLKTQAIARGTKLVEVDTADLRNLNSSIRALFQAELLSKSPLKKKRNLAFSYPFTPDLTIWCNKSYPNNNHGRPRLEAYFCEMTPEGKAERGFIDRGAVLENTAKRIVKLNSAFEIVRWLEKEYPFSFVRERTSKNKTELSEFYISIRESAIEYFAPNLSGKNLALKTFWYLYPNLQDVLQGQENYRRFCTIATETEIGMIRLQDITDESVGSILEASFPNDSAEELDRKFSLLSKVLDKAVEYEYCESNPLAQTIQDNKKRDKLFSQVRNALTKKHFTQAELAKVYTLAKEQLNQGHVEYIGVIMRIMTGLNANVICGLKWKDLISVNDYGIQKLVVARQVTNDGKTYKGLENIGDYLCFPVSDLLSQHLKKAYQLTKELYPAFPDYEEWSIVRCAEESNRRGGEKRAFAPRKLELLCKQLMAELHLPDRIVTLFGQGDDNGTKETNLNAYGGDFFRENFRYWSLSYAGMTNDETAYLIGNTPETTFGRYYCDFLNDASQYLIYIKLRRLDSLFDASCETAGIIEGAIPESLPDSFDTGEGAMSLQLQVNVPKGASCMEIDIASNFALSILVASVKESRPK